MTITDIHTRRRAAILRNQIEAKTRLLAARRIQHASEQSRIDYCELEIQNLRNELNALHTNGGIT